jgi:hypothetical protein
VHPTQVEVNKVDLSIRERPYAVAEDAECLAVVLSLRRVARVEEFVQALGFY